ncbi:acyl-CoA reductase LuxC [Algoriphagus aquaeductus]|uniref:Acyl-CoA reductase LuxC n=1 Tax=Algoriphagus aquaeductus TaxID=475299 RepID=A0A326SBH1_9BACT|nr:acyl-CoA reductase [Algoriphagus aquaeductus]PZV87396.1 acyl-CoA reductase LuxC [Algoriphagus aquaeductus]
MNLIPTFQERVSAFIQLGKRISELDSEEKFSLFRKAENQNTWFTFLSLQSALDGISFLIKEENLERWLSAYSFSKNTNPKKVGILMAGNIPGVGFHDLMSVLISGHVACIKLSSSDSVLMKWIIDQLISINPKLEQLISVEEMLKNKDAYIATGSDNSARYFEYYFGKYPHIIRANRTSVAVLTGKETEEELSNLGDDIFQYFGLGCRNVSKLFVQNEEILIRLLQALESRAEVASHHKYHNNYEYNKSIYLVNGDKHLDNGFLILKESQELVSPVGVLYFEKFTTLEDLKLKLTASSPRIQCVIGRDELKIPGVISFGQAQMPAPWDYADGVDTLQFLLGLD